MELAAKYLYFRMSRTFSNELNDYQVCVVNSITKQIKKILHFVKGAKKLDFQHSNECYYELFSNVIFGIEN